MTYFKRLLHDSSKNKQMLKNSRSGYQATHFVLLKARRRKGIDWFYRSVMNYLWYSKSFEKLSSSNHRIHVFRQLKVINGNFIFVGTSIVCSSNFRLDYLHISRFIYSSRFRQHTKAFLKCLESLISIYIITMLLSFRRTIAGHLLYKLIYEEWFPINRFGFDRSWRYKYYWLV